MFKLIKQSKEEKIKMYEKMQKSELIEMLLNCNEIIDLLTKEPKIKIIKNEKN